MGDVSPKLSQFQPLLDSGFAQTRLGDLKDATGMRDGSKYYLASGYRAGLRRLWLPGVRRN
jgi:hypothetical protein